MTKIIKPKAFAVFLVLFIQTREKSELMDSSYNLIKSLNPSYRLLLCSILATKQSWPSHETSKNSKQQQIIQKIHLRGLSSHKNILKLTKNKHFVPENASTVEWPWNLPSSAYGLPKPRLRTAATKVAASSSRPLALALSFADFLKTFPEFLCPKTFSFSAPYCPAILSILFSAFASFLVDFLSKPFS